MKEYKELELEIIRFEQFDVISTSDPNKDNNVDTDPQH